MGKSTNGPDATDVAMMMGAMESLHGCRVGCLVTTHGEGHLGILHISLVANFDVLPGSERPKVVKIESEFPCRECATLDVCLFKGMYALDYAIAQAYQQLELPGL